MSHIHPGKRSLEKKDFQKQRKMYDNIHGFIYFPEEIWQYIDTPQFQRLRSIKQLGTLFYVFPGATHTRFEHCIGTGHLARKYIQILIKKYSGPGEPYFHQKDREDALFTATLAGIMHDIGHGPYSHTFDGEVIGKNWKENDDWKPEMKADWKHEDASLKIFEIICKNRQIQRDETVDEKRWQQRIRRILDLIDGNITDTDRSDKSKRPWQFELISNKLTGIDVDKMDYFRRDGFYLGAKNIWIDHELLMNQTQIIQDEKTNAYRICYPLKYFDKVMDIYHSRYKLYKTYYLNYVAKGIEGMICEALKKVSTLPQFNFVKRCQSLKNDDIEPYLDLTDDIVNRIQYLFSKSTQGAGFEARQILMNIKKRNIYRFVMSCHHSYKQKVKDNPDVENKFNRQKIREKLKYYKPELKDHQFMVVSGELGFGMRDKNPMQGVLFFNKGQYNKTIEFKQPQDLQNFNILYRRQFLQKYISIYITDSSNDYLFDELKSAFQQYITDSQLVTGVVRLTNSNVYQPQARGPGNFTSNRISNTDAD